MPSPYVKVAPIWSGRTGRPFSASGEREYVQKFRVVVDDVRVAGVAVGAAPGIPRPFSPYIQVDGVEYDLLALCVEIIAEQEKDDDWQTWVVTCRYSTVMPRGGAPVFAGYPTGSGGSHNNPELTPPELEWDFETAQQAVHRDLDGKPFLNSALSPFTPAPSIEVAFPVLVMTRNEIGFNAAKAVQYAYAVNSDKFLGADPETVLCYPPRARYQFRGALSYWRVTYRLKFNTHSYEENKSENDPAAGKTTVKDTWQPKYLDAGTMRIDTNPASKFFGRPVQIMRGVAPATTPVLLDGKGNEAPRNDDGTITEHYIKFRTRRKLSFATLIVGGMS